MASIEGLSGSLAAPLLVTPQVATPQAAALAYQSMDGSAATGAGNDFGSMLSRALDSAVQLGQQAETQSMHALTGQANLTEVVQAVSRAELALQTTTAIRDRMVQAYQDIMRMPI